MLTYTLNLLLNLYNSLQTRVKLNPSSFIKKKNHTITWVTLLDGPLGQIKLKKPTLYSMH